MSYAKAMKHYNNIRKCKKQRNMHFGFDSCSGPTPSIWSNPRFVVGQWFKDRHFGDSQHARECIREQIQLIREKETI
jgi:hypothetical protein